MDIFLNPGLYIILALILAGYLSHKPVNAIGSAITSGLGKIKAAIKAPNIKQRVAAFEARLKALEDAVLKK